MTFVLEGSSLQTYLFSHWATKGNTSQSKCPSTRQQGLVHWIQRQRRSVSLLHSSFSQVPYAACVKRPWLPSTWHSSVMLCIQSLCLVLSPPMDSVTSWCLCKWSFFTWWDQIRTQETCPVAELALPGRNICYSWQISGRKIKLVLPEPQWPMTARPRVYSRERTLGWEQHCNLHCHSIL